MNARFLGTPPTDSWMRNTLRVDWDDVTDPLSPAGIGSGAWMCPARGEDGELPDLVRDCCPACGSEVERT